MATPVPLFSRRRCRREKRGSKGTEGLYSEELNIPLDAPSGIASTTQSTVTVETDGLLANAVELVGMDHGA